MQGALYILFSCVIVIISASPGLQCNRPNEKLDCVQVCPPEKTCRNKGIFFSCISDNKKICQQKCICIEGYRRNDNGECIPENECDDVNKLREKRAPVDKNVHFEIPEKKQCLRAHEFFDCGPECDNVCSNLHLQNRTNCPIKNIVCNPKCYCLDGYARDKKGDCVPVEKCDNPALRVKRSTPVDPFRVRECKGPNEFYQCGPACDNVCVTLHKQNRTHCPIVNVMCNSRCYCNDGYARDETGVCVPIEKCNKPVENPGESEGRCTAPNEIYTCKNTCPPEMCFSLVARFKCDSTEVCKPRCACKPGYLRVHEKSACVPICQCLEMRNSPDCQNKI